MKSLKECTYSAFISYASPDNDANYGWISQFCEELRIGLSSRYQGFKEFYEYKSNGVQHGRLASGLEEAIEASFLMVVFIHEAYWDSPACREELRLFVRLFGNEGLRQRFFIVVMGKKWVTLLRETDEWSKLIPADQVYGNFTKPEDEDKPMEIYLGGGKKVVDREFKKPFDPFRDAMLKLMKDSDAASRTAVPPVQRQVGAASGGDVVFGAVRPELASEVRALAATLKSDAPPIFLSVSDLMGDLPTLRTARRLVLAFNEGQPLMAGIRGGHLSYQFDQWLKLGRQPEEVTWLYLEDVEAPKEEAAKPEQLAYLRERMAVAVTSLSLCGGTAPSTAGDDSVLIYIESNVKEFRHWDCLGQQMKRRWDKLAKGLVPPLRFIKRGLPIDYLEQFSSLDDADGFVLLWGEKEPRSLVSQISEVEKRIRGSDLAPSIVAFLMPPQQKRPGPVPAWGWQVLRFNAEPLDDIDVVEEEEPELDRFLLKILKRVQGRRPPAPPQRLAVAS